MSTTKYRIIFGLGGDDLERQVNRELTDGWVISGSLVIDDRGRFYQPMIREEPTAPIQPQSPPTVSNTVGPTPPPEEIQEATRLGIQKWVNAKGEVVYSPHPVTEYSLGVWEPTDVCRQLEVATFIHGTHKVIYSARYTDSVANEGIYDSLEVLNAKHHTNFTSASDIGYVGNFENGAGIIHVWREYLRVAK